MASDGEFEMTPDEMGRIKEAMKDKEFVKLLLEYSEEISDPENKKKYEDEIIAMEKQRGHDVKLLSPQSGFVVKTERMNDGMKIFVNICSSPQIQEYSQNAETRNGKHGTHVSLPHSLSPVRDDIDKGGKPCLVYDVCFHPQTYQKSVEDIRFRQLLIDTAFDSLEKQSNAKVNRKKKRFPKMKYKGMPQTNIIRPIVSEEKSKSLAMDDIIKDELNDMNEASKDISKEKSTKSTISKPDQALSVVTPEYKIVHRGYFDMQNFTHARENFSNIPKELVVEIKLPRAKSAAGIDLDIFEKELKLDSKDPAYNLQISLPYKVKDADGKAQFDTNKKLLLVTLPVVKPERSELNEITTLPSVVDLTPDLDVGKLDNELNHEIATLPSVVDFTPDLDVGKLDNELNHELGNELDNKVDGERVDNIDTNLSLTDDNVDETVRESCTTEESVSSMLSSYLSSAEDEMNLPCTDDTDEDTVVVDIDTIREHLIDTPDNVDIEFDTSAFECFRPSSKLPSYSYTQTPEQINLTVDIPDVRVVYLSLGFSEQQAYMSYPRNPDDVNSPCWELVIRLDEESFLDKDNCGVDVIDSHLELILRKRHDCLRLWEKIFIGLSEKSLQVEFFTTADIAADMLKSIDEGNDDRSNVMEEQASTVEDATELQDRFSGLESRLSQLLQNEDKNNCLNDSENKQTLTDDNQKTSMHFKETNGVSGEVNDNTEDNDDEEGRIALQLKQVDINNTEELLNGRVDSTTTEDESPSPRRQMYGRSLSLGTDSSYEGEAVLHSILKHSRSDGEYYCDTEEDELSCSANSFSDVFFDDTETGSNEAEPPQFGRRRIKSVTFNDEPIIFEFAKLTKKQIKKQMKEEKLRLAAQQKGIQCSKFSTSSGSDGSETEQKVKSRKKDKCEKKKNRSYSDGLLQVPNSILSRHKMPKKKKRNRKNSTQSNEDDSSNCEADVSPLEPNPEKTPVLSNPLIFELE